MDVCPVLCNSDFYPRPPRGGRRQISTSIRALCLFLSTPSARRATGKPLHWALSSMIFLSTPSARRATCEKSRQMIFSRHFYPSPPRGGRQKAKIMAASILEISIHALREEGDQEQKA